MGIETRVQTSQRVTNLLASKPIEEEEEPHRPPPSAAALRLAEFDPLVRRAINNGTIPKNGRLYNGAGGGLNAKKDQDDDGS
jgi:hypothetical protein